MVVLRPTLYEQDQSFDRYAERAAAQGVLLRGHKDRVGTGYSVVAFRADTEESLNLSFPMTLRLATNQEDFTAALDQLLAQALAKLVPSEVQATLRAEPQNPI